MIETAPRRVDWLHIPVLDRSDDAFFAPLAKLRPGKTRIYLGVIHNMERFADRVATARRYLPDFGLAAYCGLGRVPPAQVPAVLDEHRKAMVAARLERCIPGAAQRAAVRCRPGIVTTASAWDGPGSRCITRAAPRPGHDIGAPAQRAL